MFEVQFINANQVIAGEIVQPDLAPKDIFYSLREFAMRICIRYTSSSSDPASVMCEGFIRMFRFIKDSSQKAICCKSLLKEILVDECIKRGKLEAVTDDASQEYTFSAAARLNDLSHATNPKEIIDALRSLPFLERTIFNMLVIDNYGNTDISSKLNIPYDTIDHYLKSARKKLAAFFPVPANIPAAR
jgi:DNA-directed RNA polymerase specialized sigma24 family protein